MILKRLGLQLVTRGLGAQADEGRLSEGSVVYLGGAVCYSESLQWSIEERQASGGAVAGGEAFVSTGRSARILRIYRDERDLVMLRLAA